MVDEELPFFKDTSSVTPYVVPPSPAGEGNFLAITTFVVVGNYLGKALAMPSLFIRAKRGSK